MLSLAIKSLMEKRGIENPNQFLVKSGFNYYTASRVLNNVKGSVSFKHLEMLCIALHCSVEDLILWTPPKGMKNEDKHPLAKLKARKQKGNISSALKDLPPDKLDVVREYIEKLHHPE
jgi:DNA-binding Xre family transcriptional regulator